MIYCNLGIIFIVLTILSGSSDTTVLTAVKSRGARNTSGQTVRQPSEVICSTPEMSVISHQCTRKFSLIAN